MITFRCIQKVMQCWCVCGSPLYRFGFKTVWMCEYLKYRDATAIQKAYSPVFVDLKVTTVKQLARISL